MIDPAAPSTPVRVYEAPDELGRDLAGEILRGLTSARARGARYLLGFPSGRSLAETYRALVTLARNHPAGLQGLVVVLMDEYLAGCPEDPGARGFELCPEDAHYSCRRFAREHLVSHFDGVELWCPDPRAAEDYDRRITLAGGIDLFLLASGASDGHVAFNPPGTSIESRTRVVAMAESTRRDNLGTFPAFRDITEVPTHGVSVGLGTIASLSRAAVMVIHGEHKRAAAQRLLSARGFEPEWPATVVHACRNAMVLMDRAAAG